MKTTKLNSSTSWPFPTAQPEEVKPIPVITGTRSSDAADTVNLVSTTTSTTLPIYNAVSTSLPIDWSKVTVTTSSPTITVAKDSTTTVLNQRAQNYGKFTGIGKLTQTFKEQLRAAPTWKNMQPDQRESLDMIVHKMARILNGNCDYADSWIDIAGYARLVADRLETGHEH
jgi:hypothetical protein